MDTFLTLFAAQVVLGGPGWCWSTCMGRTCGSRHDWPTWQFMAHIDQHVPHQGSTMGEGRGTYWNLGGLLGGNASVARNRQNKELFSNIILQMDQSNTTDKFISHSVWQTITLFQCVQHYSTFVFWVFWFSLHFQACERCSTLSGQKWKKNSSRLFYLN